MSAQNQFFQMGGPLLPDTTSGDSNVRRFTVETTHKANAVPRTWHGQLVRMTVRGGTMDWFFSWDSAAAVDATAAATDAGTASENLGERMVPGQVVEQRIPKADHNENHAVADVYFCREGSTASSVCDMSLISGRRPPVT